MLRPTGPLAGFVEDLRTALAATTTERLAGVSRPRSAKVRPARVGDLVQNANHLIGVVSAVLAGVGEQFECFLISEMWVLLQKEALAVLKVSGVNDCFQSGPVKGEANEGSGCGDDLAKPLLGQALAERFRELLGDLGDNRLIQDGPGFVAYEGLGEP